MARIVGRRPEGLGGDRLVDDLDDIPRYFVQFESDDDIRAWADEHHQAVAVSRVEPHLWYAAYEKPDYYKGDYCGDLWYLRSAADGVGVVRALAEELAELVAEELTVVVVESGILELGAAGDG